jgi:hypothetical protein
MDHGQEKQVVRTVFRDRPTNTNPRPQPTTQPVTQPVQPAQPTVATPAQPAVTTPVTPVAAQIEPREPRQPVEQRQPATHHQTYERPISRPHHEKERPAVVTPVKEKDPAPQVEQTGFVLIKSAPPFAALTINGKPQGETPMNAFLEVPVGKCHVEIVHRLSPPFDTVINVSPGFRREFKFKLDR